MMPYILLALVLTVCFSVSKPLIDPPYADRMFPYVKYEEVWRGTPAASSDVAVPNFIIVVGKDEDPSILKAIGMITFYIGNWVDDAYVDVSTYKEKRFPRMIYTDEEAIKDKNSNLMVVGSRNAFVEKYGISFKKPTIKVIKDGSRYIMFVGGSNVKETLKAINYIANIRLAFKGGAYSTFFSFVKLRGMIEKGEFSSALDLIRNPRGISACGRNMSIALGMGVTRKWSEKMKKIVKKRNIIMYRKLPEALEEGDKDKAITLWEEAMRTCYSCHQGIGIPRVRKFVPREDIHSKHQRIGKSFGLSCSNCHRDFTRIRGYSE